MKLIIKGLGLSALVLSMFAHADSKTLNVYAWGGYLPEASLKAFEKQEGVTINYSTFENNESMYTKLKLLKGSGYDVVFASAYFIEKNGSRRAAFENRSRSSAKHAGHNGRLTWPSARSEK